MINYGNGSKHSLPVNRRGVPRLDGFIDLVRGGEEWSEDRRAEVKRPITVQARAHTGYMIRIEAEIGARYDLATFKDRDPIWDVAALLHDPPYKNKAGKFYKYRIYRGGELVENITRKEADTAFRRFLRDAVRYTTEPLDSDDWWARRKLDVSRAYQLAEVEAAYLTIRAGGSLVWGRH